MSAPANAASDLVSTLERHRAALELTLARLTELPNGLRQALADHQWASIPKYVGEKAYTPSLAAGVPLLVPPQISGLVLITSVVVGVPAGATGLLQLDDWTMTFPPGTTSLPGLALLLKSAAIRQLTVTAQGPASVWLCGEQLPTYGVLAK